MSTHVVGIKPPDERWLQMKAIWDACNAAGIEIPDAVDDYFEGKNPDPSGVVVDLQDSYRNRDLPSLGAVTEWQDDVRHSASGFEVDLSKVPSDVRIIRFYNSW